MKAIITIIILSLPVLAAGQSKPPRFIDTCKMDTIHHDRHGDFTVIGKDTVRNGLHEYLQIKKRVKNKKP